MLMRVIFLMFLGIQFSYAETFIDREDLNSQSLMEETTINASEHIDLNKYKVKQGDLLDVSVKQDHKLDGSYRVGSDGFLNFPLIGLIRAVDKTPVYLAQEIANHLAQDYIRDPKVTVLLKEYTLPTIHLVGAFFQPGIYPITEKISLLKAIEVGGGPARYADLSKIELVRIGNKSSGKKEYYDYNSIKSGVTKVPELEEGDTLIIKELPPILVEGGVNKPGPIQVISSSKLSQVINSAGGFSEMADISTITISEPNKESQWKSTIYDFNHFISGKSVEPIIEPGHKVYVEQCDKKMKFFGKTMCIKNQSSTKR